VWVGRVGVMGWCYGLVLWVGVMGWCYGLVLWVGVMGWCDGLVESVVGVERYCAGAGDLGEEIEGFLHFMMAWVEAR